MNERELLTKFLDYIYHISDKSTQYTAISAFLEEGNHLMNWTSEYPTQPGYYWVKNRVIQHGELPTPCVVVVTPYLSFYEAGIEIMFDKAEILSAEWFGPIQPPGD